MKRLKLNKKAVIIAVSCLVVLVVIILAVVLLRKDSQESELTNKLKDMGSDFYEEFYYKQVGSNDEERANFLKKYTDLGIKVNLDNLSRYNGQDSEKILKEFVNKKTKDSCDKYTTQVIIYPQDPYKQDSYKIDVELECGFNEKNS